MTIYSIIALAYLIYSFESIVSTIKSIFNREYSFSYCSKCFAFWFTLPLLGVEAALLVSLCVLLMDSFIVTKL